MTWDPNAWAAAATVLTALFGGLRMGVAQLKIHLSAEFASKQDIKRIEHKIDHLMRGNNLHARREERNG